MDFASIWVILKLVGLASQRLSSPSLGSLAVLTSLGSALARTTDAHKPDRKTVLTFNMQCAELLLLSLRLNRPGERKEHSNTKKSSEGEVTEVRLDGRERCIRHCEPY